MHFWRKWIALLLIGIAILVGTGLLYVLLGQYSSLLPSFELTASQSESTDENVSGTASSQAPQSAGPAYPTESADYRAVAQTDSHIPALALLDVENNTLLAGRKYNAKIYPASMVKVMTLLVAAEELPKDSKGYTFSQAEYDTFWNEGATIAGFPVGEEICIADLYYGMILPSGADAAMALAKLTAGDEAAFVERMNAKAAQLGLQNTHFTNATGLHDKEQYTTAADMTLILAAAMQNETCAPVLSAVNYQAQAKTEEQPGGILWESSMFARMYGNEVENVQIVAGKTGYTPEAKHCLVQYAVKDGKAYVLCMAKATDAWNWVYDGFTILDKYLP